MAESAIRTALRDLMASVCLPMRAARFFNTSALNHLDSVARTLLACRVLRSTTRVWKHPKKSTQGSKAEKPRVYLGSNLREL